MGRIQKAYEAKFRRLLAGLQARRADQGVDWFLTRARHVARTQHLSLTQALTLVYRATLRKTRPGRAASHPPVPRGSRSQDDAAICFWCDAGLGGLARWLRAAGYEAQWSAQISDAELLRRAQRGHAIVITTDSLLMERRLVRDGHIVALWVPPSLKPLDQLALVLEELRLPLRDARCMNCGGPMEPVDKEALRERIPPRTYKWLDEYFRCRQCGQLFWHGTHWRRIQQRLQALGPPPALRPPLADRRSPDPCS